MNKISMFGGFQRTQLAFLPILTRISPKLAYPDESCYNIIQISSAGNLFALRKGVF